MAAERVDSGLGIEYGNLSLDGEANASMKDSGPGTKERERLLQVEFEFAPLGMVKMYSGRERRKSCMGDDKICLRQDVW